MDDTLTAKVADVDADYARHLRQTCNFDRQRALVDLNTKRLSVEMDNDRFIPGTTVYLAVLPDRSMLILNGNHTLEAIIASGKTQRLVLIFKKVADVQEAARLYSTFDIHKVRSWTDALKAIHPEKKIPLSNAVMPAVGHIMQSFTYDSRNVEANNSRGFRFNWMDVYEDAAGSLMAAMTGAPTVNKIAIKRKGITAVALETLRYQPGHAAVFWKDCAHDDGLAKSDPRKVLLRWLLNAKGGAKLTGPKASDALSRAAIGAWNAWYRGDALQTLKPLSGAIKIEGTPWDGKGIYDPTKHGNPASPLQRAIAERRPGGLDPSDLTNIFETGVKVTEGGNEPVVLYRKARG